VTSWVALQAMTAFIGLIGEAELRYAYDPDARDRIDVIITYPNVPLVHVCTQLWDDETMVAERCWRPTDPHSEIDHWDDWPIGRLSVVVTADTRSGVRLTAVPIELEHDSHVVRTQP
jgi:hypothetical protein